MATVQAVINAMFITMFNRTADSGGYNYWLAQPIWGANNNAAISASAAATTTATLGQSNNLADIFESSQSAYFNAQYGGLTDNAFITALYQNLGGNTGNVTSADLMYWQAKLDGYGGDRGKLTGNFTSDFLNIDLSGSSDQAAIDRQNTFLNKEAVSENWVSRSSESGNAFMNAQAVNDDAFNAQVNVLTGVNQNSSTRDIAIVQTNAAADSDSLAPVVGQPDTSGTTFTLTPATDSFAGGIGDDSFVATYSDGGTNTFNAGDTLAGNGGTDTLKIDPSILTAATTLNDNLWTNVSGIEYILIKTNAGAQTVTTGTFFDAAFKLMGVHLTPTSTDGAINIDMSTFTGPATLTTASGAGAQTLQTGSGLATVIATTDGGAQTISGANLAAVTATLLAAGAQTITSTGAGAVTVTAIGFSGAQTITTGAGADNVSVTTSAGATNTITTGAGNDIVTLSPAAGGASLSNTITGGTGADVINLGAHAASTINTLVYAAGDATSTAFDKVSNFALDQDVIHNTGTNVLNSLQLGSGWTVGATVGTDQGLATKPGATLSDFLSALTVSTTVGYAAFDDGQKTYVAYSDGTASTTNDVVVELVGITGSHGVDAAAAAGTIHIV